MIKNIKKISDDFKGMAVTSKGQYWVFGKGYYKKWRGSGYVYHRGKRFGHFQEIKEELRQALRENKSI